MKRSTRAKLRALWTPERRALARERALERLGLKEEDLSVVPVLAEPDVKLTLQGPKLASEGEARESTRQLTDGISVDSRGGAQRKLRVVRVPFNPRMVECAGGSGCENVMVHVGRNGTLAVGDEIFAEPMKGQSGCYEFVRMVNEGLRVDHIGLPLDRRRWEARV